MEPATECVNNRLTKYEAQGTNCTQISKGNSSL